MELLIIFLLVLLFGGFLLHVMTTLTGSALGLVVLCLVIYVLFKGRL